MGQKTSLNVPHGDGLGLRRIADRGPIIGFGGMVETFVIESHPWHAQSAESAATRIEAQALVAALYQDMTAAGSDTVKTKTLRTYDGQQGFTLTQGQ